MAIYAVQYIYSADAEELAGIRPDHRAYMRGLFDEGKLLASGPFVDRSAALFVFRADDPAEVAAWLDSDPFEHAGFIGERIIEEWNPVNGPWEAK